MSTYNLAQAKDKLSALVDEAMAGKSVVITRHGRKVAELRAFSEAEIKPVTKSTFEWIRSQTGHLPVPAEDAGTLVRGMREEDDH